MADIHAQNGEVIRAEPIAGGVLLPYNALTNPDGTVIAPAIEATQQQILAKLTNPPAVSGSVSVSNFPASQPVTGAFFQTTQPVSLASAPLPTNAATENGNLATLVARTPVLGSQTSAGSSPVVIANDQTVPVFGQTTTATGSISALNSNLSGVATANSAVEITLNGASSFAMQVAGTFSATLSLQVTVDGATWQTRTIDSPFISVAAITPLVTVTSAGIFQVSNLAGIQKARVTATAYTSGTANLTLRAVSGVNYQPFNAAGTGNIGSVVLGTGNNVPGYFPMAAVGTSTNITTRVRFTAVAGLNGTVLKASAGRLYKITLFNAAAAVRYMKFTNTTTITPGSTPVVNTIAMPSGNLIDIDLPYGDYFSTGICVSFGTVLSDTDTTGVLAANDGFGSFWVA